MNLANAKEEIFLFDVKSKQGPVNVIGIPLDSSAAIQVYVGANSEKVASNLGKFQPILKNDNSGMSSTASSKTNFCSAPQL